MLRARGRGAVENHGAWAELIGMAGRPHPSVAEAGVAGALMLLRDRVPVRDSCVLKSWGEG